MIPLEENQRACRIFLAHPAMRRNLDGSLLGLDFEGFKPYLRKLKRKQRERVMEKLLIIEQELVAINHERRSGSNDNNES